MPDRPRERPRGSSVWLGLDPFGDEVVARLARWFTDDEVGRELAAANQILPGLRLDEAQPDEDDDDGGSDTLLAADDAAPPMPGDAAIRRVEDALAALLAAQQSREALRWADREVLTPHVWVVADLCSAETADLAGWLSRLDRRLDELHVEARMFLLVRHLSWGLTPDQQRDAAHRARALVDHLVGETTPGRISVMAYVLTDRDAVGGYYDERHRETIGLAFRFADTMLLTDVAHGNVPGAERAFVPPVGGGPGGWDTMPVFASAAGACLHWDAPSVFRENAERRRAQLFSALAAPVPATFDPAYPHLDRVRLADEGRWPQLDVPRWSPRFWRSSRQEFDRYRGLLDAWLIAADDWRHEMLVVHRDRRQSVQHHATATLDAYRADVDSQERVVLVDDSLRGFFAPMHRLYDRATADLQVRASELRDVPDAPPEPIDAVALVKPPREALANADEKLIAALERKINPLLLLQVTLMTIGITWALVAWTLIEAKAFLAQLVERVDTLTTSYTTDQIDGFTGELLRQARELANLGIPQSDLPQALAEREVFGNLWQFDWLRNLIADLPDNAQIILWSGFAIVVPLVAIAVFTALRQRIVLERAWDEVYGRACAWRDDVARRLPADIRAVEQSLTKANVASAQTEVVERRARMTAFEALGHRPLETAPPDDDAVTGVIRPGRLAPQPLSDLEVAEVVASFKRSCTRLPSDQWVPDHLLGNLFEEAAEQAGDPAFDPQEELRPARRRVLRSMPPDGAVRVQQLASTSPAEHVAPPVARFLAAPASVVADLKVDPAVAATLPLPVDTRFYALVVQSGMSARRVLSRPTPWDDDPPNPDRPESGRDRASDPALGGNRMTGDSANGETDEVASPIREPAAAGVA